MNQLRVEGKRLPSLAPTDKKGVPVSLNSRPEYRFHKDVIEAWLIKSNMVSVDSGSAQAAQV